MRSSLAVVFVALAVSLSSSAQSPSPYAGQQQRDIKALSSDELDGYLSGKGMGLARAAELNGYPGPMHVLELADALALTPDQRARTQALFDAMKSKAIEAGRALVDAERALDELFRSKAANRDDVANALDRIARRQAEVRRVHLDAHLAQFDLLRPEQVQRYNALRGYGGNVPPAHGRHGH